MKKHKKLIKGTKRKGLLHGSALCSDKASLACLLLYTVLEHVLLNLYLHCLPCNPEYTLVHN